MDIQLSKNFMLSELVHSEIAYYNNLRNEPTPEAFCALCNLVSCTLQPLRDYLNEPITINSGYRTAELNRLVKGVYGSQHIKGEAADIRISGDAMRVVSAVLNSGIPYDQCIFYTRRNFVHVSYSRFADNKRQIIYQ